MSDEDELGSSLADPNQQQEEDDAEKREEGDGETQLEEEDTRDAVSEDVDHTETEESHEQVEGEDEKVEEDEDTRDAVSEDVDHTEIEESPEQVEGEDEKVEEDEDTRDAVSQDVDHTETEESHEQVEGEDEKEEEDDGQTEPEDTRYVPTEVINSSPEEIQYYQESDEKKDEVIEDYTKEDTSDTTKEVVDTEKVQDKTSLVPESAPSTTRSKVSKHGSSFAGIVSTARKGSKITVDENIPEAVKALRSKEYDSAKWICAKFEDNDFKKPLILTDQSEDPADIQGISAVLREDEAACVFLRVVDVVDDITNIKFVYILWIGEDIKPLRKGKVLTHKGDLESIFEPYHVYIHATQHADIDSKAIRNKIGSVSGSKSSVVIT